MAKYSYTKQVNVPRLLREINESTVLSSLELDGIRLLNSDNLCVSFVDELNLDEKAILDGIVEDHSNESIPASRLNTIGQFSFVGPNRSLNRWLRTSEGSRLSSDKRPAIFPNTGVVSSLTYHNSTNNSNVDVEIYKNSKVVFVWEIRNSVIAWRNKWSISDAESLMFSSGDRLSIFSRKVSGKDHPRNILISIHYRLLDTSTIDGTIPSI